MLVLIVWSWFKTLSFNFYVFVNSLVKNSINTRNSRDINSRFLKSNANYKNTKCIEKGLHDTKNIQSSDVPHELWPTFL